MPPRWMTLLIVVAWILTTGRLVFLDLLPRLIPGTPPAFSIELTDEPDQERAYTFWNLFREDRKVMRVKTRVKHIGRDEYDLSAQYDPADKDIEVPMGGVLVQRMTSSYRVNAAGDIRGVRVHVEGQPDVADWLRLAGGKLTLDVEGTVDRTILERSLTLQTAGLKRTAPLPEIAVPRGGAILMPFHPAHRLRDLWAGQSWTVWLFDPVEDALKALQGGDPEPRPLRARVAAELETLEEGGRVGEACRVIDWVGDGIEARTLVSERTGLVMLQEVKVGKVRWRMVRD